MIDCCWYLPGTVRSGGMRAYVGTKHEIPDMLLPGRYVARWMRDPKFATAIRNLTSRAAMNVAPWAVKEAVSFQP